jgi:hypothetical protein
MTYFNLNTNIQIYCGYLYPEHLLVDKVYTICNTGYIFIHPTYSYLPLYLSK